MYVEKLKSDRWAVCEDDGTVVFGHPTKSAATLHMREYMRSVAAREEYPDDGPTDPWETSGPGRR